MFKSTTLKKSILTFFVNLFLIFSIFPAVNAQPCPDIPCDDGNPCTIDYYDENCNCVSTYGDDEGCEPCQLTTGQIAGTPCDDGDPCTIGTILLWDEDCQCGGGTILDENNDGVCDIEEGCTEEIFDAEDFESGWGLWNPGGKGARKKKKDSAYADSGEYCVRLKGFWSTALFQTDELDLSYVEAITIDFSFIAAGLDDGNDYFTLQKSTDGGVSFEVLETWVYGEDFENDIRYYESISIAEGFSASMIFKIQNHSTNKKDFIYFDDPSISVCAQLQITDEIEVESRVDENEIIESSFDFLVYPNPTRQYLTLELPNDNIAASNAEVKIFTIDGRAQFLQQVFSSDNRRISINTENLQKGLHVLSVTYKDGVYSKTFLKQ